MHIARKEFFSITNFSYCIFISESDRLAVSHLRPNHFSEAQRSKAKFILGVRNPKDAMVSLFYHLQKDLDFELKSSWDDFFQHYSSGKRKNKV